MQESHVLGIPDPAALALLVWFPQAGLVGLLGKWGVSLWS